MQANPKPRRTSVPKYPGVFKSSAGSYEFAYRDSDGALRFKTVGKNLQETVTARADMLAKLRRGERVAPTKVTFAEFAAQWLDAQQELRPHTRKCYAGAIETHLNPVLGRRKLADITVDDVTRIIARMRAAGLSAWTVRAALTPLGRILGHAARRGLIASNPVRRLERGERPSVERRDMRILDREQIAKLLDHAEGHYRPLLAVAVFTGLRLGEILGLTWGDCDFDNGTLGVRKQADRYGQRVAPKTPQAVRDVVLMPALAKLLRELKMASPYKADNDFVFASAVGTALGHRNVSRRGLDKAVDAAGLRATPRLRFHDLRHCAASAWIAAGLPVTFVSRQLGHADSAITLQVYAHLFDSAEHASRATAALEASYGGLLDGNGVSTGGRNEPQENLAGLASASGRGD